MLELDRYIGGQDAAKKSVAIALRNRWRRQKLSDKMREEVVPNNIILIGSTGVGKTEIARRLANLSKAPFIKVEASKFTEVGYVGRDVESIIRDLMDISVSTIQSEMEQNFLEEAENLANERLLDILFPINGTHQNTKDELDMVERQNVLGKSYEKKCLMVNLRREP